MANNLAYAQIFQTTLDKAMVQQSVTGWMEDNSTGVIYDGGNTVKVPKISMQGLGNYNRASGFVSGDVTLAYETFTFAYDRGRKFSLDAMDVNETNFVATASAVMSEFQRTKVAPEIDSIRLSKLAQVAIASGMTKASYTPAKTTIVDEIKDGIAKLRDKNFTGEIIIHCTYNVKAQLEKALAGQLAAVSFTSGGVNTLVPALDGCPIIPVTSDKMYSSFDVLDGTTSGKEAGGVVKSVGAKTLNFLLVAREVPLAISKTDNMRIFDPQTNQAANAWAMDYRKYHDIWVLDNKVNGVYVSYVEA